MFTLLSILIIFAWASTEETEARAETDKVWIQFKKDNKKKYKDATDEKTAFHAFKENELSVDTWNEQENVTFLQVVN